MNKKDRAAKLMEFLDTKYSDAKCSLEHKNPFELIVATVLSAQCTDERVNKVTGELFDKYPTPDKMSKANVEDIMNIVRPTGFYKNKAHNILKIAEAICNKYEGMLPLEIKELVKLPGVGRKTANVVIGNFSEPVGIVVDTHVKRIAGRLGLTCSDKPDIIEKDLMTLIPKNKWNVFSHQMIDFGREICSARKPKCIKCDLSEYCEYFQKKKRGGIIEKI
jgi:endonuclease-3